MPSDPALIPELLPPTPMPLLAPTPAAVTATRVALAGMALLAAAGAWRAAAAPALLAQDTAPRAHAASLVARPIPSVRLGAQPTLVSAGQPAALSLPAGGDRSDESASVGAGR